MRLYKVNCFFLSHFCDVQSLLIHSLMKKSDNEHIQRSRFLESGQAIKTQIETIVRSINLKYPELAGNIEIPNNAFTNSGSVTLPGNDSIYNYVRMLMNKNLLA